LQPSKEPWERRFNKSMSKNAVVKYRVLLVVVLAASLVAGCTRGASNGDGESSSSRAFPVTVTQVKRGNISALLSVSGTIAALPNHDVRVSSLVAGRISRLTASQGDLIHRGEILARINSRPYQERLMQAQAALTQAQANLQNAEFSQARDQTLFERGIVAKKYLEADTAQVAVDKGALKQAQAGLALAQLDLARTQVRSPLSGVVVQRFVSDGEHVGGTASQPLFEIANLNQVELYANVSAMYFGDIHVGQTLSITTDAYPGKTFEGKIVAIAPSVDPSTNVGVVRIRLANPGGAFRLGMYLSTKIPIESHRNTLVVPLEAVYRNGSNVPEVYQVQGSVALARPVELGIQTNTEAEILSGASEGETIVLKGAYGFGARTPVQVTP
jgi:cobalt-zinc-cadmium efflux system membrane fusion protein